MQEMEMPSVRVPECCDVAAQDPLMILEPLTTQDPRATQAMREERTFASAPLAARGLGRLIRLGPASRISGIGFVTLALGLHLLLLWLAQAYWRLPERPVAAVKPPKIQAYLLYSPAKVPAGQAVPPESQTAEADVAESLAAESQIQDNQVVETHVAERRATGTRPAAETPAAEPQAIETEPAEPEAAGHETAGLTPAAAHFIYDSAASVPLPYEAEAWVFSPPETDARLLLPEAGFTPTPPRDTVAQELFSRDVSTLSHLQRQRREALDTLVRQEADAFTAKRSMSEMDAELEVLLVPNADDFSQATTLGNKLDPNRIVRKGDTCYRVVKVGNQLNPYAENLGYPFDCSGKKMNQDIQDAIDAKLAQMHVKQRK
ncbi:hypothetical protein [Shewanella salipaludis]|uniref:Uncharacterized protein n=1 Tax=Shewanella salipaludis TaxID=2723052 RepID=A0A972JL82_9GAMM|nr:hypothetical protein [Shewanella salipaludis]NMH63801.1 hypothetical protein [Shewanella salipaludis]